MKYLILFFILCSTLFADNQLIIDSNFFEADDQKGVAIFTGNVKVTKIEDKLNCDKLVVNMIKDNQNQQTPEKYTATGNVDFNVYSNDKVYYGKGDTVIYEPFKNRYTIFGNGYLEEKTDGRILYGEEIYLDEITAQAKVVGKESKPVRFMMKLQDTNKEKQ
ncbi:MAG: lipopolysaccharide transport periplasmic protein LptA [Arcobacter butzleri]|nr:lipopolysaccharide transport periplasmic protein LptA [Arcobacteraceae bacterium]MDY0365376.1 LptA/OstA family protein [Arcobacteraceae bacterium]NLO17211.1 lipopolysaccharide transport periplasmic protein LptA [Aliarcobacter butzleri]